MRITIYPANEYQRERWPESNGWSRHILTASDQAGSVVWRLAIHEINQTANFSAIANHQRELVLLHGEGAQVRQEENITTQISPPFGKGHFSAETPIVIENLTDRTCDLIELLWHKKYINVELMHRPLVGSMVFFTTPWQQWIMYVLTGQARFVSNDQQLELAVGDTACIDGLNSNSDKQATQRAVLDGGGELLIAKITYRT